MAFVSSFSSSSKSTPKSNVGIGINSSTFGLCCHRKKTVHSISRKRKRSVIIAQRRSILPDDEAFVTCKICGSDEPISASAILRRGSINVKCGQCREAWTAMAEDALTITGDLLTTKVEIEGSEEDQFSNVVGVKLFISGLGPKVNNAKLRAELERFGEVVDARVIYDKVTGRSRGFGFVTVVGRSAASAAIDILSGDPSTSLGGRLTVKEAND